MEERALAVVDTDAVTVSSPLDMVPQQFKAGLVRRSENRKTLIEWIRSALVEDVDFGSIPTKKGPSKPSLWKPGAEKICGMLNVVPSWPNLKDYEGAALAGVEIKTIILRCEIVSMGGQVLGEGTGARALSQDYGDLNKALKMAKKSALIDATLTMGGLSEVFTQDIEDMNLSTSGVVPVGIGPERASKFLAWCDSEDIARNHAINASKKYHGTEIIADLTEEQAKTLMFHLKDKSKERQTQPDATKTPQTAQESPQTLDPPSDPPQAEIAPSAAQEPPSDALFPDSTAEQMARYNALVKVAEANNIPMIGAKNEVSLFKLINECWTDRGDTDMTRMPEIVAERVDVRLTEIINARKQKEGAKK